MPAPDLVELAALIAVHGPTRIRAREPIPQGSVEEYWVASKSRLDRWARTLKGLDAAAGAGPLSGARRRDSVRGVLEEILSGEVLTRVWAAVTTAHDRHHGTDLAEPAARSVLVGHLEARHRVLTLLVRGPGIDAEFAVKLNRLRRRSERWTDMLIGQLLATDEVAELAVEPARAREFAEDSRHQAGQPGGRHARSLVLASLRAAFRQGLAPVSPNADLNARIADAILSCFPPELFDSTGVFRSAWLMRLTSFTDDAEGMIEELLRSDSKAGRGDGPGSRYYRLADRLRRFGS